MIPTLAQLREVFILFLVPVGGGIPAGVILAHKYGIIWPIMAGLYFLSDVVLACVFEPLMLWFMKAAKKSNKMMQFLENYKSMLAKSGVNISPSLGPMALIGISFGVDPMTGRAVAKAAGHNFFTGWAIAICGDMFFFLVIMSSTLWLSDVLGDGTLAVAIVMVMMIFGPSIIRRIRNKKINIT